jgi:hypothetical protein
MKKVFKRYTWKKKGKTLVPPLKKKKKEKTLKIRFECLNIFSRVC